MRAGGRIRVSGWPIFATQPKFLATSMSLDDVIVRATWNPAKKIRPEELGHFSPGAAAEWQSSD